MRWSRSLSLFLFPLNLTPNYPHFSVFTFYLVVVFLHIATMKLWKAFHSLSLYLSAIYKIPSKKHLLRGCWRGWMGLRGGLCLCCSWNPSPLWMKIVLCLFYAHSMINESLLHNQKCFQWVSISIKSEGPFKSSKNFLLSIEASLRDRTDRNPLVDLCPKIIDISSAEDSLGSLPNILRLVQINFFFVLVPREKASAERVSMTNRRNFPV